MSQPPRLTHLQFVILGILLRGRRPGREIREELRRFGVARSGPAFYQLMGRLEEAGLVEGSYQQQIVEGQIIRERTYELQAVGRQAWNQCRRFNEQVIATFGTSGA